MSEGNWEWTGREGGTESSIIVAVASVQIVKYLIVITCFVPSRGGEKIDD